MNGSKKGVIWISAVLYVMIAVVVMVIVLEAGLPLIKGLNERGAFNKITDTLIALDKQIQTVASEGQGSQRVIPIEISDGEVKLQDNKLRWKLETESKIVEPRTRVELGNLVIASDVDVSAKTENGFHIIENSRILANITQYGSKTNFTSLNTSQLINYIKFKDNNAQTNGTFTFFVNDSNSITGNGYTELKESGTGLTSAIVLAHVNNSAMEYDLELALESKADFLKASISNFRQK